jgi:hypothetical protein
MCSGPYVTGREPDTPVPTFASLRLSRPAGERICKQRGAAAEY